MTTVANDELKQMYRGVIALNNYGISLVEKQDYSQALLAYQDALKTLQTLLDTARSSNMSETLDEMHKSIQRAALRMATITTQHQKNQDSGVPRQHEATEIPVHIVSTGDYDKAPVDDLLHQARSPNNTIYLVRIDDVDSCTEATLDDLEKNDFSAGAPFLEMHVPIVLLNLAMVRYCMSVTALNENEGGGLNSPATIKLGFISQEILNRLFTLTNQEGHVSTLQHRILCLSYTLALNQLVVHQVLVQFGRRNVIIETTIRQLEENLERLHVALVDGIFGADVSCFGATAAA